MVTTGELNQLSNQLKLEVDKENIPPLTTRIQMVYPHANYNFSQSLQSISSSQDVQRFNRVNNYLNHLNDEYQGYLTHRSHYLNSPSSPNYEILHSSFDDTTASVKFSSSFQIENVIPSDMGNSLILDNCPNQVADDMMAVKATSTSQNTPTCNRNKEDGLRMTKNKSLQQVQRNLKRIRSHSSEELSFQDLNLKKLKE